jgi:hypothetical protein
MFEMHKQGISGESDCSKVAEGKHHLKSKAKFNALKWTLQLCPILFVIYIIVKAVI